MNLSQPFIRRPIGTVLLTIGVALAGIAGFFVLPVSPLPEVDFPVVSVQARLPGASPQTMATSVATPLERRLGIISGVNEMTSTSSNGATRINLQFDLSRDIDGAAREVQAAINASRSDLPATLRSNPTYRKANPADAPILILALTSTTRSPGQIYDAVSNIVQQKIAQVPGVGDVELGGGSLPAVRIEANPTVLSQYGIALEDVRAAVQAANANRPKGELDGPEQRLQIYSGTQQISNQMGRLTAADYRDLVVAWRNGAPVRLSDVATVRDGQEDIHTLGLFASASDDADAGAGPGPGAGARARAMLASRWHRGASSGAAAPASGAAADGAKTSAKTAAPSDVNAAGQGGRPAVIVLITRQPGANIITTVDGVRALLPELRAQLPADISLQVASDRTNSIRASLHEVEVTLLISIVLVVGVVSVFLRSLRATIVPAVATVVSLLGTFGVMYVLGFSLDNLSLMALTVATGFVVDDAIVVLENTSRHIEQGMGRLQAALLGAREVGFTVLSISLSLVAVFIPLIFMGGQVGRLFREFAVTLSVAVLISLVISLTTTPMLCAWLLRPDAGNGKPPGRLARWSERGYQWVLRRYEHSLDWALDAKGVVMAVLACVVALNVYLFVKAPKGFFPQQDTSQISGGMSADQSISFQAMQGKLRQLVSIIHRDPAVDTVVGFTGGARAGGGFMFVNLKPLGQRKERALAVIARLRPQLARVTGVSLFLNPVQDLRMGGRASNATYQYTLKSDNFADLRLWSARLAAQMKQHSDVFTDVDTDQQDNGVESYVNIDHETAARLGIASRDVDNALYDAFGQRQVATIYSQLNQYHVILEAAPQFTQSPQALREVHVPVKGGGIGSTSGANGGSATSASASASAATPVINPALRDVATGQPLQTGVTPSTPLPTIASFDERAVPASIAHQDGDLAVTVSFNLADGRALGDAQRAIAQAESEIHLPTNVHGSFAGTARSFQESQGQQPLLIVGALVVIYIVLGVLYESLVHPVTVLSTLPSAGVGAVLALLMFNMEFSIIALIGIFLLIGIVKKNAILIIDFALDAERGHGLSARDAVREACLLRFRPILMTTLAAALGALPLAIGFGEGAELRQPLGIAIIGGLIASQLLTLLTTPVVYLLLDRWRRRSPDEQLLARHPSAPPLPAPAR
jgi:multidrug efflux pump